MSPLLLFSLLLLPFQCRRACQQPNCASNNNGSSSSSFAKLLHVVHSQKHAAARRKISLSCSTYFSVRKPDFSPILSSGGHTNIISYLLSLDINESIENHIRLCSASILWHHLWCPIPTRAREAPHETKCAQRDRGEKTCCQAEQDRI